MTQFFRNRFGLHIIESKYLPKGEVMLVDPKFFESQLGPPRSMEQLKAPAISQAQLAMMRLAFDRPVVPDYRGIVVACNIATMDPEPRASLKDVPTWLYATLALECLVLGALLWAVVNGY